MLPYFVITLLASVDAAAVKTINVRSPGGMFSVQLDCQIDKHCDGFKKSIELVTQSLENAFSLEKRIDVRVVVDSGLKENVGATTKNEFVTGPDPKANILYDRALAKQLFKVDAGDYPDFTVTFNGKKEYFFPGDYGTKKKGYLVVNTMAHEFLHGMGFGPLIQSNEPNNAVIPFYLSSKGPKEGTGKLLFVTSPFTKNLFTKEGKPLNNLIDEMNKKNIIQLNGKSPAQLEPSAELNKYAKEFEKKLTTHEGLYFKTSQGNFYLNTKSTFDRGSTMTHVDDRYNEGKDYLMTSHANEIDGTSDLKANDWPTAPLGPLTLEVMQAMGYKLNPKPSLKKSLPGFYPKKGGGNSASSALKRILGKLKV
ncbi:hypothetical protein DSO57_1038897 [Entomophthora muscae]|uniref:Uncharacterized protein n=1 Tax=Entomophthora muscae TaxID=34485 RepID=A0ACC2U8Z8_9FUNG|nr:hypothetical protein DSO57_1038897 [Entomophthora muscae]